MGRKEAEEYIIKCINKIDMGSKKLNGTLYKDLFKRMSDSEFKDLITGLKNKTTTLSMIVPNGGDVKISVENNFNIAKEIGLEFFHNLKFTNNQNGIPNYTTPNKYLVYILPIKRAAQLLSKKISIAENNNKKDILTGQVTSDSKASKLTYPELQVLSGLGLKDSLRELTKIRGGDDGASRAMDKLLYHQGSVSQSVLNTYAEGAQSTKSLKNFLLAMHIRSTL